MCGDKEVIDYAILIVDTNYLIGILSKTARTLSLVGENPTSYIFSLKHVWNVASRAASSAECELEKTPTSLAPFAQLTTFRSFPTL